MPYSSRPAVRILAAMLAALTVGSFSTSVLSVSAATRSVVASSKFDSKIYTVILEEWDADNSGDLTQTELDKVTALDLSGCSQQDPQWTKQDVG